MPPRYALLSVSNKSGLIPLGESLVRLGFTLLSTGGTAKVLSQAGVPVTQVAAHTGAPEIMDGRVKTLHPRIHGAILGDRVRHAPEALAHDIPWIDVVVVNLYPFERVAQDDPTLDQAIETIDIGGPTMVRSAAKNHQHVMVLTDPADYDRAIHALETNGNTLAFRRQLAIQAFWHTSRYDSVIASWLTNHQGGQLFPPEQTIGLRQVQSLRYGENPHQQAAFYADWQTQGRSLARLVQHHGKHLSFNNIADLDAAVRLVYEFEEPACVIVKHMNPAGCATAPTLSEAFSRALAGDPVSAFGGIVAFNKPVTPQDVRTLRSAKTFFEVVVAPGFTGDALDRLRGRKNLRVIELPSDWAATRPPGVDGRRVQGGWLLQSWDLDAVLTWQVVSERSPTDRETKALRFAWNVCKHIKSNAICIGKPLASGCSLNGAGAGQMSRVESVRLAVGRATLALDDCVMASDAFLPFADGLLVAAQAGIQAVIQPGGSIRDDEVIAAANQAGVAMVFTETRHFRH